MVRGRDHGHRHVDVGMQKNCFATTERLQRGKRKKKVFNTCSLQAEHKGKKALPSALSNTERNGYNNRFRGVRGGAAGAEILASQEKRKGGVRNRPTCGGQKEDSSKTGRAGDCGRTGGVRQRRGKSRFEENSRTQKKEGK